MSYVMPNRCGLNCICFLVFTGYLLMIWVWCVFINIIIMVFISVITLIVKMSLEVKFTPRLMSDA